MKTTLKATLTAAIARIGIWFQMTTLRITLDGKIKSRAMVSDPALRHQMSKTIFTLRCELESIETRWIALQPRRSWRTT